MTLLNPAALWTLAALALPLAIHLRRRPPRTVRLGSLRFLPSRPRRWQNLRWRERALLLARLGLLATLAFLLARPVWRSEPSNRPRHWALLDPAAAPAGPSLDRLRALRAAGVETRLLAPGFPVVRTASADPGAPVPDLWSLLREADATLPPGSSLAVFSPGRLASLRGVRPALTRGRMEWINTPPAAVTAGPPPAPVPPPPTTLKILILHDADRAADARYVAAAWRAISRTDQRPLTVATAFTTAPTVPPADWIFWLSARAAPPDLSTRAARWLDDAATPATADPTPSWIVPQPGAGAFLPPVRLWQRGVPSEGSVVWTDGVGQPLLTRTDDAHGTRWHFASRFHPAWTDLPLGTALPASLRGLLAAANPASSERADHRLADPSQCQPADTPAVAAPKLALPAAEIDGRPSLWLLAVLLFGLERILCHRCAPLPAATVPASAPEPALVR